jgi:formylglycine-generating enzyme required for sulfatase activity
MRTAYAVLVLAWAAAALCDTAVADNHAPAVSNVTASQRTDESKLVDIRYDLVDDDGDACTVTLEASNDGGTTWTVPITAVSEAVGTGITPGVNKLIVWNSATDLPGAFGSAYKVRVRADDGHVPAPPGMVTVAAGSFQMGDPWNGGYDAVPVHTVYLSPYCIDTYEVTNEQYAAALNWAGAQGGLITVIDGVVYKYGSGTSYPYCKTVANSPYSRITWDPNTGAFAATPNKESHPMLTVGWYGSVAYCNWRSAMADKPLCYDLSTWACNFAAAGYRLPTEAEWEKAAAWDPVQHRHFRYGEHTDGCGTYCLAGDRANYGNSGDPYEPIDYPSTTPVGYYDGMTHGGYATQNAQSYYGCYDMTGNVSEWCYDWYDTYASTPQTNPTGPGSGTYRILRGGSWNDSPEWCWSAYRNYYTPDGLNYVAAGFRCAVGTPSLPDAGCADSPPFTINNAACPGDTNCDGRVTFGDIDPFVEALGGQSAWNQHHPTCPWLNADCNHSGTVTFADIDPFVAVIGTTCQ